MPIQLKIRNFQSLEDVNLELTGFTVVTGQSNLGKSAIVRAVEAAIFGRLGDYYVKYGEDQCGVGIQDLPDLDIKWRRVKQGRAAPGLETSLEVGGQRFTKYGRDQGVLTENLGFRELETSGGAIRPQFAGQFDRVFLLMGSETEAAEVLKLLGRVDVVTEAQKLAGKDTRAGISRLEVRREDQKKEAEELAKTDWVAEYRGKLRLVQAFVEGAVKAAEEKQELTGKIVQAVYFKEKRIPVPPVEVVESKALAVLERIAEFRNCEARILPAEAAKVDEPKKLLGVLSKLGIFQLVTQEWRKAEQETKAVEEYQESVVFRVAELEKMLGKCPTCGRGFQQ